MTFTLFSFVWAGLIDLFEVGPNGTEGRLLSMIRTLKTDTESVVVTVTREKIYLLLKMIL